MQSMLKLNNVAIELKQSYKCQCISWSPNVINRAMTQIIPWKSAPPLQLVKSQPEWETASWQLSASETFASSSWKLGALGVSPRTLNMSWSASKSLLGVVKSFSPVKMELAPARKHSACSGMEKRTLPADNLTIAFGMTIRAVAIIRIISHISTGWTWN